jgi:hypothetical protein
MTFNEQEFEQLVDGEYMTQVEDAGFGAALAGVKLALAVVNQEPGSSAYDQAMDYLLTYGNLEELPVSVEVKYALTVMNYDGDKEEADAQIYFDLLQKKLTPPDRAHSELWYQYGEKRWYLLEAYKGITRWTFYFEQGVDPKNIKGLGSSEYLYSKQLDDLICQVREAYKVDIYEIPIEQWLFSPDEKKEGGV